MTTEPKTIKWISVKDKLPEHCMHSLLVYGTPMCGTCPATKEVREARYHESTGFEFGEYDCGLDATHWAYMPSPPGEDDL